MLSSMSTRRYTASEFLDLSDCKLFELVDGTLRARTGGALGSWVAVQLAVQLGEFVRAESNGWLFDSLAEINCFGEARDTVRRSSVVYVQHGRFPDNQLPNGSLEFPPDLVADIVFPDDRYIEVLSKLAEYLAAGIRLIWVVNPADRSVTVYSQESDQPVVVRDGGELTGGDVLPRFRCAVSSLFPPARK